MLQLPDKDVSYWRANSQLVKYHKLHKDISTDVVIVGGGIVGLTCAYVLKQAGLKVVILEKDTIGAGTTGRTTGKVTSQHNIIYSDLQNRLGSKFAKFYAQANQQAIGEIEKIIKNEKISCGWQREDSYVYTNDKQQIAKFKHEAKVAAKLGLPASFETYAPLPFPISGAIKISNQAKFDAQKYILGLAKAVNKDGSHVFSGTRAVSFNDGMPAIVKTKDHQITAKDIIVATNVPSFPLMARGTYCLFEYPVTSYVVAGRVNKQLSGMYISPDKNNYSIFPITIKKQKIVLIGGRGHLRGFGRAVKNFRQLANYGEDKFGMTSIDYKWSAWDYLAYDNVPMVGRTYPWSKHLYVATAFKKWGLSHSWVAARILSDLIMGQESQWADVYYPHRASSIKSIPRAALSYIKR